MVCWASRGIVQGRRARNEIDAQPGRYAGRSQAVAGIVTGTIGVVIAALVVLAIIAVVIGGIAHRRVLSRPSSPSPQPRG